MAWNIFEKCHENNLKLSLEAIIGQKIQNISMKYLEKLEEKLDNQNSATILRRTT
jgi:hypothetical protein